jgi:RNA polymerase sigma factor (sigma-70 family)
LKQRLNRHINKETPEIISQIKKGDMAVLESVYRQYAKHLYNYGSKFSNETDLIEDSIQELFLTLWTRREYLGTPASFKNYLFKAFRINLFKKIKLLEGRVNYDDIENYHFQVTISVEDHIISAESSTAIANKVQESLNELTPRQREAIFLKFYEGLSYEEIAQVMGITVKGSYKLIARAIDALKEQLTSDKLALLFFLLSYKTER